MDRTSDNSRRNEADQASVVDYVALAPGQPVGRYEILEVLGQGGFGITYRARDTQLDRDVALKEYLPPSLAIRLDGASVLPRSTEAADDFSWGRERFVAEGRTLASLHEAPAIVQVFDFLEANGTAYMVMELLRGETLEQRVKEKGPLSPREVDALLWPLLDGLEQVHATGFLHRDIKPGNILLNESGAPTLIDFGAARAAIAGRTSTMTAIFTPGYAAPEQFTTARQGAWTDVYGLSATLYHAVTGAAPPNAFDRLLEDRYEPLAKLRPPGFPPALLIGIDAGLEVRFEERPQSIAGWRSMLGGATSDPDSDATVVMPQPPTRPTPPTPPTAPSVLPMTPRVGHWPLALAALGIALVLLGGGYYFFAPMIQPQPAATTTQSESESGRSAQDIEATLLLKPQDRQRIQILLTSLGFDTRGKDGEFGPRSREMIAAWQKARGYAPTGYLTPAEMPALLRETPSVSSAPATPPIARPGSSSFDGSYGGGMSTTGIGEVPGVVTAEATITGGRLLGRVVHPGCGTATLTLLVAASGEVSGNGRLYESQGCALASFTATGRVSGDKLVLELRTTAGTTRGTLDRRGG